MLHKGETCRPASADFSCSMMIREIKLAYRKAREHGRKEGKKGEEKQDNVCIGGGDSLYMKNR